MGSKTSSSAGMVGQILSIQSGLNGEVERMNTTKFLQEHATDEEKEGLMLGADIYPFHVLTARLDMVETITARMLAETPHAEKAHKHNRVQSIIRSAPDIEFYSYGGDDANGRN